MKNKKWIFRFIGLIILAYILYITDFHKYYLQLQNLDITAFLWACFLILIVYILKSLRWKLLLNGQQIRYSFYNALLAFTSSNFIAFITPGRLGEFAKIFYLKNDRNVPFSKSLPNVITDRLFDVYVLLFFGFFGIIRTGIKANWLLYMLVAISVVIPFLFFNRRIFAFWIYAITKLPLITRFLAKRSASLKIVEQEFQKLININLFYALIISCIAYVLLYYISLVLTRSIGLQVDFIDIILIISVANILSFLPITISGLGTREAVIVYFFHRLSYSTEQALLFSTLFFICFYIVGGLYGYLCFMIKPVSIRKIQKEIE